MYSVLSALQAKIDHEQGLTVEFSCNLAWPPVWQTRSGCHDYIMEHHAL